MLTKEERKEKNTQFWSAFKKHMQQHRSSNGRRMNWLTYPTEIKDIYLRLETEKNAVAVNFDIQFKDAGVRAIFWEQMGELKSVLSSEMNGDIGEWIDDCSSATVPIFSRIQWRKEGLNYMIEEQHEAIFSFFEEKLLGFDAFYQEFKEILLFLAK